MNSAWCRRPPRPERHRSRRGLLDFPKIGFNADSVVITGDEFFDGGNVGILSFNKSTLLSGDFTNNLYTITGYPTNWGLMPARMHGAAPGDPMYFVDEAGWDNGSAIRVWTATGLNSGSPTFSSTDIGVNTYGFPVPANQPGGPGSVATNFAWIISADWQNNILVAAHNATIPGDNFSTTHAIWYEFSTSGTPSLMDQGVINSGQGVHSYMPSVAVDAAGDIGITYMESSNSEYISMYVGAHVKGAAAGATQTVLTRAGDGYLNYSFRTGDYSSIVFDQTRNTFWASNEYSPANSGTDIWATYIASFQTLLAVTGSDPAAGSVIATTPTDFTINWSDAIDPNSLSTDDLIVNGIAAHSVTVSADFMTTVFHYDVSPVTTEGLQTMDIPGGARSGGSGVSGSVAASASLASQRPHGDTVESTAERDQRSLPVRRLRRSGNDLDGRRGVGLGGAFHPQSSPVTMVRIPPRRGRLPSVGDRRQRRFGRK